MTHSTSTNIAGATHAGWIAIATLLRPQGRRGELLAEPLSDLAGLFVAGRKVMLSGKGMEPRVLEESWTPTGRNAGKIVLKLSGCDSIGEAETLAGRQVLIPSADMPALGEDTYFVGDLVGCAFFDGDHPAGAIVDVEFPVGSDGRRLEDAALLLAIVIPGRDEPVLVPFIRAWLRHVDVEERRVVMQLPEGLLSEGEIVGPQHDDEGPDAV